MSSDVAIWETRNLAEHVGLIKRQFVRSLSDGELRKLVTKIVTHTPDDYEPDRGISVPVVHAYGRTLRLPQLSAECIDDEARESQALWDFAVLNIAYTPDPPGYDLFMTTRYTLESGQGDCDDFVIALGSMHRMLGFEGLVARVVSTNAESWEHVYLLVGYPKRRPKKWVALDPTVRGALPGWQYEKITTTQDFPL